MFTGIIEAIGEVVENEDSQLILTKPVLFDDLFIGSSICVSGVCLSVISFDEHQMFFDVIETTKSKTKIGLLQKGDRVNLERAMRADGRFEGHIVQGHSEGVGKVVSFDGTRLTIHLPPHLVRYCISEGSITLDGVSLTIASLKKDSLTVALIPHTLENTTLGLLKEGESVNIETDVLGRYVMKSE
jgi:riboflavin synthase